MPSSDGDDNAFAAGDFKDRTTAVGFPLLLATRNRLDTIVGGSRTSKRFNQRNFTRAIEFRSNHNQIDIAVFMGFAAGIGAKKYSTGGMNAKIRQRSQIFLYRCYNGLFNHN
jgi:hypothetical protein